MALGGLAEEIRGGGILCRPAGVVPQECLAPRDARPIAYYALLVSLYGIALHAGDTGHDADFGFAVALFTQIEARRNFAHGPVWEKRNQVVGVVGLGPSGEAFEKASPHHRRGIASLAERGVVERGAIFAAAIVGDIPGRDGYDLSDGIDDTAGVAQAGDRLVDAALVVFERGRVAVAQKRCRGAASIAGQGEDFGVLAHKRPVLVPTVGGVHADAAAVGGAGFGVFRPSLRRAGAAYAFGVDGTVGIIDALRRNRSALRHGQFVARIVEPEATRV